MAPDKNSEKFLIKFGLKMRELRNSKGWTLEQTEDFGWVSWKHLQQIESGKKNINLTTIQKLAKLYKITLSELLKDL